MASPARQSRKLRGNKLISRPRYAGSLMWKSSNTALGCAGHVSSSKRSLAKPKAGPGAVSLRCLKLPAQRVRARGKSTFWATRQRRISYPATKQICLPSEAARRSAFVAPTSGAGSRVTYPWLATHGLLASQDWTTPSRRNPNPRPVAASSIDPAPPHKLPDLVAGHGSRLTALIGPPGLAACWPGLALPGRDDVTVA